MAAVDTACTFRDSADRIGAGSKKLWDDRICLGMPGSKYASGCGSDRTGDLEGKTGEERRRMKRCRQVKFLEEWCSIFWMLQKAVS